MNPMLVATVAWLVSITLVSGIALTLHWRWNRLRPAPKHAGRGLLSADTEAEGIVCEVPGGEARFTYGKDGLIR